MNKLSFYRLKFLFISLFVVISFSTFAQNKGMEQLKFASKDFVDLLVKPDAKALNLRLHNQLSYGHSGGKVEDKASLIASLLGGDSDFVTIEVSEDSYQIVGKTGIVRHIIYAKTNDKGKSGEVKLKILLTFVNSNGTWKLLARQAIKLAI